MITFITPSIRLDKLETMYNSIDIHTEWEMVVLSPYAPSFKRSNVRWYKEMGNLVVCRQKGLLFAKGEYVTWAVDDSVYVPGALDKAFDMAGPGRIVSMIMTEGKAYDYKTCHPDHYRASQHTDCKLAGVPQDTLMINFAICDRKPLIEIGGWDCKFEGLGMADVDLSIRLRKKGIEERITDFLVVKCEHMPGITGDHAPIHNAHFENDRPYFVSLYREPTDRLGLPLANYFEVDEVWKRRFGG